MRIPFSPQTYKTLEIHSWLHSGLVLFFEAPLVFDPNCNDSSPVAPVCRESPSLWLFFPVPNSLETRPRQQIDEAESDTKHQLKAA